MPMSFPIRSPVPHDFEGEYGLGAATGMSNPSALAENEVYSYKIDF